MLSGECRIDAIPVNGQAVLLEGLRLRLDLRLAPSAAPTKAGERGQRTHSALLPRRIQRLAALGGLAALLSALGLWFAGAPAPPPHGTRATAIAVPPIPAQTPPVAPIVREVRPIVAPASDGPAVSVNKPVLPVAKSPAPARPPAKPAARPPATDREMLDLFGDTK